MKKLSVVSWKQLRLNINRGGGGLFLFLFIDPYRFSVFLSCYCIHSDHWTVYLTDKATLFYKNIGHITVTPIRFNKWLLIVDGEFFLSLSCQHPGNESPRLLEDVPDELRHSLCYITYAMDFRFVPSDSMCFASCHILISKQDSTIRALGSNWCVTGRRSRDENHAVRFRQNEENHCRARDTQSTRGISDELARGCKRWHPLAPGRRYGKKSSLWVCLFTHLSHTTETSTLSRTKCERYIFL